MIKRIYYAILRWLELDKSNHKAGDTRLQGLDGDLMVSIGSFTDHRSKRMELPHNPHFRIFDYLEDE